MSYRVEHKFAYGWDDAGWQEDGQPMRFATEAQAIAEIREVCKDSRTAHRRGDMADYLRQSDFRIVVADTGSLL